MSLVVGVSIRTTKGSPHLRGVVMPAVGLPSIIRQFEHQTSKNDPPAQQLYALGQALESELRAQDVSALVIREAGFAARASASQSAVKNRLRAEGICIAKAQEITNRVAISDANGLARMVKVTTSDLSEQSRTLLDDAWEHATSAALAARTLVP